MELLEDTHVWYALSFIVFVAIVWQFGKLPFLGMLDKRIAEIKNDIETAENLRVEAQEMLAQYQRKQRDASSEAEKIITNAKKSARQFQEKAEADLAETMNRREHQLTERLIRMEQQAMQEIQAHAADLAMKAAREIIAEKLDKKTSEQLVEQSIAHIEKHIH
jgi:F-type H+-transporting ATPase subunit b